MVWMALVSCPGVLPQAIIDLTNYQLNYLASEHNQRDTIRGYTNEIPLCLFIFYLLVYMVRAAPYFARATNHVSW